MKTKNILFILMSVISVVSAYKTSAWNFYAENNDGVRIYYNIISSNNHTVEVTYGSEAYNSYSGNIVIPSVVEYDGQEYTVTRIGQSAFLRSSGLTGIEMPSTIVSLKADCFRETGLVTLNIPENVTSISTTTFIDYCESLTTINVSPDNQVFASDDGILFTKSKHTILRCPTGRTGSVSVIPSVDTLGYNAFSMCHYVTDISFQGNIIYLDDAVFYDCRSLTSMTIPDGITALPRATFQSCSNLTQVNLPASLVSIGNQAFYYCQHLSSFTVTENVSYIGQGVFGGCSDLQSIDVVENNQYFSSVDGVLYNKTISTLVTCPGGKRGELNIPNTVENIVSMGVMNCGYLTSVTIPNSVTDLGTYFLYNSSQIHSLTIPGSVSQIKSYDFAHCYGLQDIELEEGIQIIDNNTFISCSSLSQITLPSTITSIGSNAFSSDYNLKVLRSNALTVPQLNTSAFQLIGTNIAIVPCEAKQDYLANGTWSSKFIILCDDDLQSSCYHPVANFENVSITQNNPFQWRGNQVSGTGQYIDILQTQDLTCDSIIALNVSLISDTTFPCQVTAIYPFNGTFQNPFYDNVWLSDRQVINTNTSEMDVRTQNQLRVIPEGSNYSFRLGNNSTGAQAEAMRFVYTVDTDISDIVIFKYAAVLQDPQHDESMQPRLTFKVSDAMGNTIDSVCTFADFRANSSLGWNSIGSGSNVILWKDWTTIGLDVSQYNGQNIYLTFTTYDCGEGDHYGYAYFTLDCANKKITSDNCGNVTDNTFYAPEGFEYQWYNAENPQNILSTERYLSVNQAGEYICKSSFIGNPDCSFLLSVNSGTRYPYAQFTYETEECSNGLQKIQFYNNSLVTKDEYHQILTNERCDNSYWDFGDGETSTEDNPSHWFENGSFSVTLVSSLANGQCEDEISQELNITCSDLTLAFDTVIQGGYYMDFHITQDTVIFDTLVSSLGNDSVVKHSVVTLQAIINQADTTVLCGTSEWENLTSASTVSDTIRTEDAFVVTQYNVNILPIEKEIIKTIPQGSEFFFGDEYLNLEGTYTKTFPSENGCDSIVTLHLYLEGCYANILNGDTLWVSALEDTVIQLQANNSAKYYRWSPALYMDDSTLASPTITLPIGESATYVLETMYESSVNLIENGNFEQGNVGFTSEYNYTPSSLGADGYYTIGTNPNSHHPNFSDCQQQRNILIANGSSVPNTAVYETTVDVVPNTDYAVSFEATSVLSYVLNTARFQFSVNGEMLGDIFTISDNSCQWNTYYQIWNSGNNQQATIRIINQVSAAAGNDFAIANIQFKGLCIAKDTLIVENNNVLDKRVINLCQGEVYSDYPFEDLVQNTDSLIVKEGEVKDTVYKLNLSFNPSYQNTVFDTIEQGEEYSFNNRILSSDTVITDNFQTYEGCDSTITLNLAVRSCQTINLAISNNASVYSENNVSSLTFNEINGIPTASVCAGDSVVLKADWFFAENDRFYNQTLDKLTFVWVFSTEDTVIVTGNDSVGFKYSEGGIYDISLSVLDSAFENHTCQTLSSGIVRMRVGSNPVTDVSGIETCYNEQVTLQATTEERDSRQYVYLWQSDVLEQDVSGKELHFLADSIGTFLFNFSAGDDLGCSWDTLVTVSVFPKYDDTLTIYIDQGGEYIHNEVSYNTEALFVFNETSINSCDSLFALDLHLIAVEFDTIPQGDIFRGNTFTSFSSGSFYDTLTSSLSRDSVIKINLTVLPIVYDTITDTINCGESFVNENFDVSETGIYYDTVRTEENYFIHILDLYKDVLRDTLEADIAVGETYTFKNLELSNTGVYYDTLQAQNGCDSIFVLVLRTYENPDEIILNEVTHNTVNIHCSGYFYDNSKTGNYSDDIDYWTTICPETENGRVSLTFEEFNINPTDTFFVYQGEDINSPIMTRADNVPYFQNQDLSGATIMPSLMMSSGCLTLRLKSDGSQSASGFKARIECLALCQNPQASISTSFIKRNAAGEQTLEMKDVHDTLFLSDNVLSIVDYKSMDICKGDTVIITAEPLFPENDLTYHQDESSCKYFWSFGDGSDTLIAVNKTVSHVYTESKGYDISLIVTDTLNGSCQSKNLVNNIVRVSANPIRSFNSKESCQTDSLSVHLDMSIPLSFEKRARERYENTVFIPDGPSCLDLSPTGCYETPVTFTQFNDGDVISSIDDILSICINMEHSFLGDLGFQIICPNGQSAVLKHNTHRGGANLGIANRNDGNPLCDSVNNPNGTGWTYCFSNQYLDESKGVISGLMSSPVDSTNQSLKTGYFQTPMQNTATEAVDLQGFSSLIGCPLNGEWSIRICDDWGIDNGYVFWWDMELQQTKQRDWSYDVAYSSITWEGPLDYQTINDTTIVISSESDTTGEFQYNVTIVDEFGCEYRDTATLTINPITTDTLRESRCKGDVFTSERISAQETGIYADTVQNEFGCYDIQVLEIVFEEPFSLTTDTVIPMGTYYNDSVFNYNIPGEYLHTWQTPAGCTDSVLLNLRVRITENIVDTIPEGSTYRKYNFNVNVTGQYSDTVLTDAGYDTVRNLSLTVLPVVNEYISDTIQCGEVYSDNIFTENASGTYIDTNLTSENYIVTSLDLFVLPYQYDTIVAEICDGEVYRDAYFNENYPGEYSAITQGTNGCEKQISLLLSVNSSFYDTVRVVKCKGETYSDAEFTETETGIYVHTYQTVNACDSIYVLDLTIADTFNIVFDEKICNGDEFTLYNFSENRTGTYTQRLVSENGCDSTVTLNLEVINSRDTVINISICEGETYYGNGFAEDEAGTYRRDLFTTELGCDSVVFLNLSVWPNYRDTIVARIDEGQTYSKNGFYATQEGLYYSEKISSKGCDSTTVLDLHFTAKSKITVPSAFTPAQDNNNIFYVYPADENIVMQIFQIYDRWGTKVFETSDITKGWDGKFKGQLCPQGVYVYRVLFFDNFDRTQEESRGELMLYY